MNISYNWLESLVPGLRAEPGEIGERLAQYGAPVDEMVPLGKEIDEIVIARVIEVGPHPNADRLSLCSVDAGTGTPLQIVCGAPNVRAGGLYPLAPVGSTLPGNFRIRKSKIRGVESQGMLCSERELGLGRTHEGIMELAGEHSPGDNFVEALGLEDLQIVVDITPNRPDLLSHIGIARELAPGGVEGVELPHFPSASESLRLERSETRASVPGLELELEDTRGCLRYMGAIVRGVTLGPSPAWLQARLRAVGLRPINNVVDATNYILFELGQPLHAFDLDRLEGATIRVRRARAGESIVTLDGAQRTLSEDMTVIADARTPNALAGVMGGQSSEVNDDTRNIFLECALFDPGMTRRSRTAVGLSTDSSFRFERGVDPEGMEFALRRALDLIVMVAGGTIDEVGADLYPEPLDPPVVEVTSRQTTRILGVPFETPEIRALLEPIGLETLAEEGGRLEFRVPGYRRYDLTREADLIEEVARRYGYERFPAELRAFRPSSVPGDKVADLEDRLRDLLVGLGFAEARLAPFVPESDGVVAPLNPLSSAESRLRASLLPGLLRRVETNFAQGTRAIRLFEIGTVFEPGESVDARPLEATRIALVMTGPAVAPHWTEGDRPLDIWDLKGILGTLAASLSPDLEVVPGGSEGSSIDPGYGYQVLDTDETTIGWGGQVRDRAVEKPLWATEVYGAEIVLSYGLARRGTIRFRELPAFPATDRDIALLVPNDLAAATVEATIRDAGGPLLERVEVFDLFRGSGVPDGMRSIAYRLRFRAAEKTLTDKEADRALERVLRRLEAELGVRRRG